MKLDNRYYQKLYAGILGKIIGVYVGRPFEGWINEEIVKEFGEINRYVNKQANHPLICADDDITGTFMFTHALEDHLYRKDFSSKHVGQSWVDSLIEGKTVLWWGGYGQSTEHTAWLNLKNGIEAPVSGSIEYNGLTVAEQIGAQIFIDGWALINPGNPAETARLATEAARVSHDGNAVHAAVLLAVMESQAFVEKDLNKLIDLGLSYVPQDSIITKVITDVRQWHAQNSQDWKWAFSQLKAHYGYDKFDGTCHVVPNHGLIILSLLYGGDSFHESMKIVNTLGWDTDCNAANVGCLNGIRLGLASLDDGYDWRGPIADRILLPTAAIQDHIFDALQEADKLFAIATKWNTGTEAPKKPRFHFSLPGAVQGFELDLDADNLQSATLKNPLNSLQASFTHLIAGVPLKFKTPTHTDKNCLVNESSYHVVGSPTLYSNQIVDAQCQLSASANAAVDVALFIEMYDPQMAITTLSSESVQIAPGQSQNLNWIIPNVGNRMIANIGLEVRSTTPSAQSGIVELLELDWHGTPTLEVGINKEPTHEIWDSSFVNTMDTKIKFGNQNIYRLANNNAAEPGLFIHGSNDWQDYQLSIGLTPQIKQPFGPVVRYRGLTRFYRVQLTADDRIELIKQDFGVETVIAQQTFKWQPHVCYQFDLSVKGQQFHCSINGDLVLEARDNSMPETFQSGGAGFYTKLGPVHFSDMKISAI